MRASVPRRPPVRRSGPLVSLPREQTPLTAPVAAGSPLRPADGEVASQLSRRQLVSLRHDELTEFAHADRRLRPFPEALRERVMRLLVGQHYSKRIAESGT